ncbi:MAG: tripartite tricarboxylate transporter substrate binding protein [Alphaproteobacteria bacterium]|nr:tripartite tricarboxylate transporter substrate binding protein [Alphaproteobacteria bacterium]
MTLQSVLPRIAWRLRGGAALSVAAAAIAAVAVVAPSAVHAQAYPTKPIKLLVGFAPGGPTDILARVVGQAMSKTIGEQIVVENRTGAGGNIATEAAARAEPDGYTIQMTLMSSAINESLFKNFKVRFAEHFEPIGGIASTGLVLLVHPSLGVNNVQDLIKLAKSKKPGELLYASAGAGTATHLAAELFNTTAGVKLNPVHYRGGGDTLKDLLSGEMKIMFSTMPPVIGFVKEGRLKGIATTGLKRDPLLPDLPTIAESGMPGFNVPLWFGLAAPKGTPKPVLAKLNAELKKALDMPDVKQVLDKQGFAPMVMDPETFRKFYIAEAAKWAKVVEATGLAR